MKPVLLNGYVLASVFSVWFAILTYNSVGLAEAFFVEKLLKEPTVLILFFIAFCLSFYKFLQKKPSYSLGHLHLFFIFYILFLISFSLYSELSYESIKGIKGYAFFIIIFYVGYFYFSQKNILDSAKIIAILAFTILIFELYYHPDLFWSSNGYFDLFLYSQSMRLNSSELLVGYYDVDTIQNMYRNYDDFLDGGEVRYRYGTITGSPIESGHILGWSFVIISISYNYLSKRAVFYLTIILITGLFTGTKGFFVTVFLYYSFYFFIKYKFLRVPVFIIIAVFLAYLVEFYFLSTMGHLLNLYGAVIQFLHNPLGVGPGLSGSTFDDSFFGRLMVELGIIGVSFYCFTFYYLAKKIKNIKFRALLFTVFFLSVFSGASMHFLSLFLPFLFIGSRVGFAFNKRGVI